MGRQLLAELAREELAGRELARDVRQGLASRPKRIPSRYLFDAAGSSLLRRIAASDEYYLGRCEREILEQHGPALIAALPRRGFNVVDLGAGNGEGALLVIEQLLAAGLLPRYVPVALNEDAMRLAAASTGERFPGIPVDGIVGDHMMGLGSLAAGSGRGNLVLFLGSGIGSLTFAEALSFLRRLRRCMGSDDRLLVGFDLRKQLDLMVAAYNDAQGLTAALNLNLLERLNRELGANFDPLRFRHFATYNPAVGCVESFLVSAEPQEVYVSAVELRVPFAPWEALETGHAYKYLVEEIQLLAAASGFQSAGFYYDRRGWFAEALWQPA